MKKIVIVGAGTAGLAAAAMMKSYWNNDVDISLIYDASKGNISVGESTTPIFRLLLAHLGVSTKQLIKDIGGKATIKLGINFKNWIPNTDYFHGFAEVNSDIGTNTSAIYSIPAGEFNGGMNYNSAVTTIPNKPFEDYGYAMHIDTKVFCEYITDRLKNRVKFIDDRVENVIVQDNKITQIECKNSGIIEADLFVDASGFNSVLFRHLNPKWHDTSDVLPIDRAIPQQVPYDFKETPAFTTCEATKNGWIWQIPIGDRFGTGYLYSSKFTTDEEAQNDYDKWLREKFNVELETDRIIRYKPGYYEDYWIGNCLAIGLSSGFIEPLEATGIQIIIQQIQEFMIINSTLKNLEYNRTIVNKGNRTLYKDIIDFVALHYCTNRTDSLFWNYMTHNKSNWVRDFEEKCREEFLDSRTCYKEKTFWGLDSFIQVCYGLKMFDRESIKNFLLSKVDGKDIFNDAQGNHEFLENEKKKIKQISHRKVLDLIVNK
tara:strand:+ start:576 stop:2036 length:1461 start_codon:yes stop_codon:yes gene_type:complete